MWGELSRQPEARRAEQATQIRPPGVARPELFSIVRTPGAQAPRPSAWTASSPRTRPAPERGRREPPAASALRAKITAFDLDSVERDFARALTEGDPEDA